MTHSDFGQASLAFDEVSDRLVELGGGSHPSELHGLLCGLLAGGERPGVEAWQRQVAGMLGDEPLDEVSGQLFTRMYGLALTQLGQGDFSLQLLLPNDEEPIEQRTEALGFWCHGFLSGFGEGAVGKKPGKEINGILHDFSEIARVQTSGDGDEIDENERFFMEVSEYVRMALLNIFAELNPAGDKPVIPTKNNSLH